MSIKEKQKTSNPLEFEEIHAVVSDLHMSAGFRAQMNRGLSWHRRFGRTIARHVFKGEDHPAVSDINPLEDLPDDMPLAELTKELVRRYSGRAGIVRLKLLGDTFDPHAVLWAGGLGGPPHEAVAVIKLKKIMAGHPMAMNALADFVSQPNCRLDIFIGNHDLFLVWPQVQQRLIRRLAGNDPEKVKRIRFIGRKDNFRENFCGILYYHGMNSEGQNTVHAKTAILGHRFGKKLKRPVLNEPYGSHLTTRLVYKIKLHHNWIGRMANYRSIFRNAAIHDWGWVAYVLVATAWTYIYHAFFALWHIRRKARLKDMVRVIGQAVTNEGVDGYARKLLKRKEYKAVVLGHSHEWRQESSQNGTYINTGTWGLIFRLEEPELVTSWKRFKWVEKGWLCLKRFLVTRDYRFGVQLTKMIAWLAAAALLTVIIASGFPGEGWLSDSIKWIIGIILAFVSVSGILRVLSGRPKVIAEQRHTFCLTRVFSNGSYDLQLLEFNPDNRQFKPCNWSFLAVRRVGPFFCLRVLHALKSRRD